MKDELEKVKLMRNPAARAAAAGSYGAPRGGMPAVPPPTTTPVAKVLSLVALLCGLVYAVPVLGAARAFLAYKVACVQIVCLFVSNLYSRFPLKMTTLSDPAFTSSLEVHAFVLLVFMTLTPYAHATAPTPD